MSGGIRSFSTRPMGRLLRKVEYWQSGTTPKAACGHSRRGLPTVSSSRRPMAAKARCERLPVRGRGLDIGPCRRFPSWKAFGRQTSHGPWQREPDMSTHNGSFLPRGSLSGPGWQLLTDMSAHIRSFSPLGPPWEAPGARRHPSLAGRGAAGTVVGLAHGVAYKPGWSTNRPIPSPSTPRCNRGCPRPEVPGIAWPPCVRERPRLHARGRVSDGREPSGPPLSANTRISSAAAAHRLPTLAIPQQATGPRPP